MINFIRYISSTNNPLVDANEHELEPDIDQADTIIVGGKGGGGMVDFT